MTSFDGSQDLEGARFVGVGLQGARFVESDLSGVVMRGVEVRGMDIDAPWLPDGEGLLVNGVDVRPYVEAELDRRFPGRSLRRAGDPEGLRAAFAALDAAWAATLGRAAGLPVDASVDGEWSFAQTLRHLVHATDLWFVKAVLGLDDPLHPLGLPDRSGPPDDAPYDAVLEARAGRVALVRDFVATVTPEELAVPRQNPHNPSHPETTLSCLQVILEEEWEHHRFAVRDLDTLAAQAR